MTYTIDTSSHQVKTRLACRDARGYINVPLARAIARDGIHITVDKRNVHLNVKDGEIVASWSLTQEEMTKPDAIATVDAQAQQWLNSEMTRLLALQHDLDTLRLASGGS